MPGGVIVLATPDVRSLFSHLEMFYLHFGHVSFYHPRLLCFFLDHAGFVDTEYGANPQTASPLLADAQRLAADSRPARSTICREIPPQGQFPSAQGELLDQAPAGPLARAALPGRPHRQRQPEMDRTRTDLRTLAASLQSLNGPFECFAVAHKPVDTAPSDD